MKTNLNLETRQDRKTTAPLLYVLRRESLSPPPVWIMRQAGRYLPEYLEVRAKAGSFLDLCYTPALAAEVTLQPVRRFGFDAAILFSDILIVPDALGQSVTFVEGEGPRLKPLENAADMAKLDRTGTEKSFARVYETIERVCTGLGETPLIGFCGAPWTVATYMIAGCGTADQLPARLWAYQQPVEFQKLIDLLTEVSADYLCGQIVAGVHAVQIFDSWAGVLPEAEFERWVIEPAKRITAAVKQRHPSVPVIGFPRGAGHLYERYARETGVDAIGCDTTLPPTVMASLTKHAAVQGNLDPIALLAGGEALERSVGALLATLSGKPHIFNLGHGILPETPIAHVEKLVELVRRGR